MSLDMVYKYIFINFYEILMITKHQIMFIYGEFKLILKIMTTQLATGNFISTVYVEI